MKSLNDGWAPSGTSLNPPRTVCAGSSVSGRGALGLVLFLAGIIPGCAEYRFTFDCAPRINTAVQSEGAPLDIDIVSVAKDDLIRNSQLANLTAQEWFDYKWEHGGHMLVPAKQVTTVKELRGSDLQTTARRVKHYHRDPLSKGAAIYLFASFAARKKASVLPPHQYKVAPITWEGHDYTVVVGANRIDVKEGKYYGPKQVVKE